MDEKNVNIPYGYSKTNTDLGDGKRKTSSLDVVEVTMDEQEEFLEQQFKVI